MNTDDEQLTLIEVPEAMAVMDLFSVILFTLIFLITLLITSYLSITQLYESSEKAKIQLKKNSFEYKKLYNKFKIESQIIDEENNHLRIKIKKLESDKLILIGSNKNLNIKIDDLQGKKIIIPNKLKSKVFFDSSSSEIKNEFFLILDQYFYKVMKEIKLGNFNNIQIIGYTDRVPIRNDKYKDNWDLGAARAISVVRYFISKGMKPEVLSANTYSEYRPVTPNVGNLPSNKDRRIEIVLLKM